MTALRVDLFGIECNTRVPDADGTIWTVSALDGWESPKQQSSRLQIAGRDGAANGGDFFGKRDLEVRGSALAVTHELAWKAYDLICGSMPGIRATGTIVAHEPVPKSLSVRQADDPFATKPKGRFLKFELTLDALAPFKRSLTAESVALAAGATVSVTNEGNVPALLSFTTTGAGTLIVRQDDSGQVLRTRSSVASGTHFDGSARRVTTSGGLDIFPMGAPSEWLSIPKGSTVDLTSLGTAPADVSWYHLYA